MKQKYRYYGLVTRQGHLEWIANDLNEAYDLAESENVGVYYDYQFEVHEGLKAISKASGRSIYSIRQDFNLDA